jgi:inositol 1,4,5-triphosphate receptor type 1/inositol 1,4,5-triphosphate receptor type 3
LFEKPDDLSELQELYNKILIAVMSVLEGNDEKIYEDLQNKLESRFLIDFIKQNLEILQVKDANDMTKLLNL